MTALAVLVAAGVVLASGCSLRGSEYQYVRSRSTGTYLRLPEKWKVATIESGEQVKFGRVFDGADIDSERPIYTSERPTGFVQVRDLSADERDVVSFRLMRNAVFDVDEGVDNGTVQILRYETANQGDARGERVVFSSSDGDAVAIIDQTVVIDPKTTRFHLLVVGCALRCYEEHENEIDSVVSSLTVKET